MLKKFLKDVVIIIVGKQAEAVADLLNSEKHVNEFIIAKKLDMTINQTRNILYKISDQGLVSFIRKKDKRKGWYTYFWKIEILKALEFLKDVLIKKIEQVNNQIKSRETKQFYFCELCKVEYNEENALLRDFTCPECGNVFILKDNAPLVKELKKNLLKLSGELQEVQQEIDQEKIKVDKKRIKTSNALEKEAKLKRKKTAKKEQKPVKSPAKEKKQVKTKKSIPQTHTKKKIIHKKIIKGKKLKKKHSNK